MPERLFYRYPALDAPKVEVHPDAELTDYDPNEPAREPCAEPEANLVGSRCDPDDPERHMPVFDVDTMPSWLAVGHLVDCWHRLELENVTDLEVNQHIRVMPSSTDGHSHVYVDVELPWDAYVVLLEDLEERQVIESGYFRASVSRQQTFVRKPGVRKPRAPLASVAQAAR